MQNFCSELGRQFNDLKLRTSFDEVRRFGENGPERDENGHLAVGAVRSFVSRSPRILGFLEAATGPETVVTGVNGGGGGLRTHGTLAPTTVLKGVCRPVSHRILLRMSDCQFFGSIPNLGTLCRLTPPDGCPDSYRRSRLPTSKSRHSSRIQPLPAVLADLTLFLAYRALTF